MVAAIVLLEATLKLALVCPAGTVYEDGTGNTALVEDRLTAAPPLGAGALSDSPMMALLPAVIAPGVIVTEFSVGSAAGEIVTEAL